MEAKQLIEEYQKLQGKGLLIGKIYKDLFKNLNADLSIDKPTKYFEKFSLKTEYEYKPGYFVLSYEYNDSCNCHPEYRDYEEFFPVHFLDLNGDKLEKEILAFIQEKVEKRKDEIRIEKQTELLKSLKEKQDKEKKEREQLAVLKAKYDS